jgi:hypothetical protein
MRFNARVADLNCSSIAVCDAGEDLDEGRLSRSISAEQSMDRAAFDPKRNAV